MSPHFTCIYCTFGFLVESTHNRANRSRKCIILLVGTSIQGENTPKIDINTRSLKSFMHMTLERSWILTTVSPPLAATECTPSILSSFSSAAALCTGIQRSQMTNIAIIQTMKSHNSIYLIRCHICCSFIKTLEVRSIICPIWISLSKVVIEYNTLQ